MFYTHPFHDDYVLSCYRKYNLIYWNNILIYQIYIKYIECLKNTCMNYVSACTYNKKNMYTITYLKKYKDFSIKAFFLLYEIHQNIVTL